MHTFLLPGGQRSLFKAIQIQIKQTHKSPGQNQINSSSFCAVMSACLYVSQSNGYIYIFFLTGTLVGQASIQVVISVPNNNDLPQRHTQSKQPDHSIAISLEPRGAIHINDELSTPLDIDIDQLRDELGLGEIQKTLKSSQSTESVESSNVRRSPQFDPSGDLTSNVPALETADITQIALDSSEFLPSIFEETETFSPDVAAAIAQRVNDAVSKKPLETKFKELQDKYKSPKNCNFLCVPKVNLELWHDLPRSTKYKDLGLQEIQKHLVKSVQPMIQLLDTVLKLQVEQTPVDSSQILLDAVTLLGHASYLTSLKRQGFLKPDIAPAYQLVCSKSNPVTTNLFGDELPKHIKEIGEVNKISGKTMSRTNVLSKRSYDHKTTPANSRFYQRGGRRAFLGSRHQKGPYFDRRPFTSHSPTISKSTRDMKDRA